MENELYHHGILGQKWGVRRFQNPDGTLTTKGKKRYLKEVYKDMQGHYERNVSKETSKNMMVGRNGYTVAGSNWTDAYRKGLVTGKDAKQADKAAREAYKYAESKYGKETMNALKRSGVLGRPIDDFDPSTTKAGKELLDRMMGGKALERNASKETAKSMSRSEQKRQLEEVNPDLAKNKTTRRVALDYHNMSDIEFAAKYKTTKKVFQKRYVKSNGDTYGMGKRKQAAAMAFLAATGHPGKAVKSGIYDYGTTIIGTQVGYDKAEENYQNRIRNKK